MDQAPKPDHVAIILGEIDRIDHLLSEFQLLTLPLKTLPLKTPDFVMMDIEKMINNVLILMKGQAASKNIILTFHHKKDVLISNYLDIMDGVILFKKSFVFGDEAQLKLAIDAVPLNGVGLSICYNIIESHGGKIEVQSEVGRGTTFSLILALVT